MVSRMPIQAQETVEEEPLYVNAKQYHRILKRRLARARLEAEGRIPKERPVRTTVSLLVLLSVHPVLLIFNILAFLW